MNAPPPSIREWAQRLLAAEAANSAAAELHNSVAVRVFEALRMSLSEFVGPDGFTALLRRALVLARADFPSLQTVTVTTDGRLDGIEESGNDVEPATAIAVHLLGLLVTFIGESLTLRLMRGAFPDTADRVEPEDS